MSRDTLACHSLGGGANWRDAAKCLTGHRASSKTGLATQNVSHVGVQKSKSWKARGFLCNSLSLSFHLYPLLLFKISWPRLGASKLLAL